MIGRMLVEHGLQLGMNGDGERCAGLMLHYPDLAIADVLAVHVDNVTAALTGVQQEAEGKMLASTDRPTRLEDTDLLYRPSMKAILI